MVGAMFAIAHQLKSLGMLTASTVLAILLVSQLAALWFLGTRQEENRLSPFNVTAAG